MRNGLKNGHDVACVSYADIQTIRQRASIKEHNCPPNEEEFWDALVNACEAELEKRIKQKFDFKNFKKA